VSGGARGPLRAVLDAVGAGAGDQASVAARTGLDPGLVSAAVAQLLRSGHLRAEQLATGCPASGCGSCGSGADLAASGCATVHGAGRDGAGRGPVLITLGRLPSG
jgi:hypothetical protein